MKPILNPHYNELQEVASMITGYDPSFPFTSARDENYYNLETKHASLNHIKELAENFFEFKLTNQDIYDIYRFVETSFENEKDRLYIFKTLGGVR